MIDYNKVVAVTNRHLCYNDYFEQIRKIIKAGVKIIIVREKDLQESDYLTLYEKAFETCREEYAKAKSLHEEEPDSNILCIPHFYGEACEKFHVNALHLPFSLFCEYVKIYKQDTDKSGVALLGTSVHSVSEAVLAQELGASYITAGHIFATDCKKGAPPRGLNFLNDICGAVNIPVYAIGGINEDNYESALDAGAAKVCMMSEMMRL